MDGENYANVIIQDSKDVLLNLGNLGCVIIIATEEYLYEHSQITNPVMFLWQNQKCVIIGKHQNPWTECKIPQLEKDNVVLARRKSGGGCVYEDLGNSVFSFFHPVKEFSTSNWKTQNNNLLIGALEDLGIKGATPSGRNDIVIGDRKISGSAYKINLGRANGKDKKALHHGTMMIDVDFSSLEKYLTPSKMKLVSKGIESVRSRVRI